MQKLPRLTTEDERNQIKVRTGQLVRLAGGVEFFAPVTGVNKAQLSKYGSLAETDCFIRADVIIELDRQLGAPMMVETLARMLGYGLVPLDETRREPVSPADVTAAQRETSEAVSATMQALEDGRIDPSEKREVRREIAEGIASLHRLDRKVAGGGE